VEERLRLFRTSRRDFTPLWSTMRMPLSGPDGSKNARVETPKSLKVAAFSPVSPTNGLRLSASPASRFSLFCARASKLGPNLAIVGTGAAAKKGEDVRSIVEIKARYCDKVSCAFQQAVSSIRDAYATCKVGVDFSPEQT